MIDLANSQVFIGAPENPKRVNKPEDLLYCIYTSGTTGNPKGVLIQNKGVVSLHQYLTDLYKINETDKVLQFFNFIFDGSVWEMTMALLSGATLYLMSNETVNDISKFNDYIEEKEITIAALPPQYFSQTSIRGLKILTTAGSKSSYGVVHKALNNERYINEYGPTESTVQATYWEYYIKEEIPKRIPIGRPISNTQIYIMNGDKLCGIGIPGELCIAGDGLARGYLNQPELTAEKFVKNPFGEGRIYRSGDLAKWLPDGNIEFLGRIDEQVKIRGFRVELGEIEGKLREVGEVKDVAVIAREDGDGDKAIYGYVVSDKPVNINRIREHLAMSLPDYMIPTYLMQIEKLPMTRNGKLDKRALPEIDANSEKEYIAPRDEVETALCKVFKEVLNVNKVGVKDNFLNWADIRCEQ